MKSLFVALFSACLCLAVAPAFAEFVHTNPQDARVTHAHLGKIVVESQATQPNATLEYEEGYHNTSGDFVRLGVSHRLFLDHAAVLAEDGVTVITPARPEYSALLAVLKDAIGQPDSMARVEAHLAGKIAEDRQ